MDILDSFFLLNITFLVAATFYVNFEYHTGSQTAATSTLVTSSLVIFIGIVLYHIYLQVRKTAAWEKITKRNIPQEGPRISAAEEDSGLLPIRAPTRSYVALPDVHEF